MGKSNIEDFEFENICSKLKNFEYDISGFNEINIEYKSIFNYYFYKYNHNLCDFNFNNLFFWKDLYKYKWFIYKDRLIILNSLTNFILEPIGDFFSFSELLDFIGFCADKNIPQNLIFYSEFYLKFKDKFGSLGYIIEEDRDSANYIYLSENLANLAGRKFHSKKNLVNQFLRKYPSYKFYNFVSEEIDCDVFNKCFELAKRWYNKKNQKNSEDKIDEIVKYELGILEKICKFFKELYLYLFIIEVDQKIIAFSVASVQNKNMITVHFEKFDSDYIGASQMINYLVSNYFKSKYKYINREDDMGIESLRNSKLSYNPDILIIPFKFYKVK